MIDLFEIKNFFCRTKPFPSEGLLIYQIAEIFSNNKIDICIKNREIFDEYFIEILDTFIIYPEPQRVYPPYLNVKNALENYIWQFLNNLDNEILEKVKQKQRIFLVENTVVKKISS